MRWSLVAGALAAVAVTGALAGPALAHGDHDARPLARQVAAGPFTVSLWQVYPDVGDAMTPHLIVMVEGGTPAEIRVAVNGKPMEVRPSTTTRNGWETTEGIATKDVVAVAISDGTQAWELDSVTVPPSPTAMLPVQELLWTSIVLTGGSAVWVVRRTARAWRRPGVSTG